ncbi:MAG: transposase zinc-binding domain-containing protein, partial [Deltaproteobacteria bacterium]|nr:transposase zinc-binding domain-containing protein [Deltaproteobacteria bacterium]
MYKVVQNHIETLIDDAHERHESGNGYPGFVENELRKYLDCGILARGFARLRCPDCGFERLVAFSCKGRLCPSCWARRTADVAAHLVDRVMPKAQYRQWVLTFPWEMRFLLAVDRKFLSEMLRTFLRTVFAWQRLRGRQNGIKDGQPGSIACVQRFGGILNLNPHVHAVLPDGLFVEDEKGGERLVFKRLPPPTDEDILRLTVRLSQRLGRIAKRRMQQVELDPPWDDDEQALVHDSAVKALRVPSSELFQGPAQHAWAQDKPLC